MAAGVARIQELVSRATAHPLASNLDGQPADGAMLLSGIATALYSQACRPTPREALKAAFRGDGTVLVELANALWERNASGPVHEPGRREDGGGLPGPAMAPPGAGAGRAVPLARGWFAAATQAGGQTGRLGEPPGWRPAALAQSVRATHS